MFKKILYTIFAAIALTFSSVQFSHAALTTNLVGYYKLDESSGNPADSSGNSRTLTNNNSVSFVAAKINNGADFGSANTSKYFSRADSFGNTGGALSISTWIKLSTAIGGATRYDIVFLQNNTTDISYGIWYEPNGGTPLVRFLRTRINVIDQSVATAQTLTVGTWYHLVLTYDGTTVTGYINGISIGTIAASGNGSGTNLDNFAIGAAIGSGNYVKGVMDEVGVWTRALSSTEVSQLYNSGSGFSYPFVPGPTTVKTFNGVTIANIKTFLGTAIANVKTIISVP